MNKFECDVCTDYAQELRMRKSKQSEEYQDTSIFAFTPKMYNDVLYDCIMMNFVQGSFLMYYV